MPSRFLCTFAFLFVLTATTEAERVALVMGQNAYPGGRSAEAGLPTLHNSAYDARAVAALLSKHGFAVISRDGKGDSPAQSRGAIDSLAVFGRAGVIKTTNASFLHTVTKSKSRLPFSPRPVTRVAEEHCMYLRCSPGNADDCCDEAPWCECSTTECQCRPD